MLTRPVLGQGHEMRCFRMAKPSQADLESNLWERHSNSLHLHPVLSTTGQNRL